MAEPATDKQTEAFKSIQAEAVAFYKLVVTVATTFLGGTLLFSEKFAPHPSHCALIFMGLGWALLILSIVCIAFVRRSNIEAGRLALGGDFSGAAKEGKKGRRYSTLAAILLAFGMGGVMLSGVVSLWQGQTPQPKEEAHGTADTPRQGH